MESVENGSKKQHFLAEKIANIFSQTLNTTVVAGVLAGQLAVYGPEPLKDLGQQPVTWSEETSREFHSMADIYVRLYKLYNSGEAIEPKQLRDRFNSLLRRYAPDVNVIHIGDEESIDDYAGKIALYLEGREQSTAHFTNRKLYYLPTYRTEGETQENKEVVKFNSMLAELSHAISHDDSPGRSIAYVRDLAAHGMHQLKTYDDGRSIEYQAHQITQKALSAYLLHFPKLKDAPEFGELYDGLFEFYNELIVHPQKFENVAESIKLNEMFVTNVLYTPRKMLDMEPDLLSGLRLVRTIVSNSGLPDADKSRAFYLLMRNVPMSEGLSETELSEYMSVVRKYLSNDESSTISELLEIFRSEITSKSPVARFAGRLTFQKISESRVSEMRFGLRQFTELFQNSPDVLPFRDIIVSSGRF